MIKWLARFIATIIVASVALDQSQGDQDATNSGLSLLQVIRGAVCAIMGPWIVLGYLRVRSMSRVRTLFAKMAVAVALMFSLSLVKEVLMTGAVDMRNVTSYGQVAYWVLMWLGGILCCGDEDNRMVILKSLILAGVLAAASIIVTYLSGDSTLYQYQGIRASSGGFNTGKAIAGQLAAVAIVAFYFARIGLANMYAAAGLICLCGCVLTYARAGLVAAIAGGATQLLWFAFNAGRKQFIRSIGALCLVFVGGAIFVYVVGTEDFGTRWRDLEEGGAAGSGRATFWLIAWEIFSDADIWSQIAGSGYASMLDEMQLRYSMAIHTHSDVLDALLVGGVLGIALWFALVGSLARSAATLSAKSAELPTALAIVLVLLVQALFTGQVFAVSAMSTYLLAITCIIEGGGLGRSIPDRGRHGYDRLKVVLQ